MPVAIPFIVAAAAIAGAVTAGVSAYKQEKAQEKSLDQQKDTADQNLKVQRAGLYQQAVQQKQALASAYSTQYLKIAKAEQDMSDPVAFERHNAPYRKTATRASQTEREHRVQTAFSGALPSRGYGKPTMS